MLVTLTPGLCPTWTEQTLVTSLVSTQRVLCHDMEVDLDAGPPPLGLRSLSDPVRRSQESPERDSPGGAAQDRGPRGGPGCAGPARSVHSPRDWEPQGGGGG